LILRKSRKAGFDLEEIKKERRSGPCMLKVGTALAAAALAAAAALSAAALAAAIATASEPAARAATLSLYSPTVLRSGTPHVRGSSTDPR